MKRSSWVRLAMLLDRWIHLMACLSGAVVVDSEQTDSSACLVRNAAPDLHTQLEEILDSVWREERMWRLESRIQGSLGQDSGKTRRPNQGGST